MVLFKFLVLISLFFFFFTLSSAELSDVPAKHNEEHKDHIKLSTKNEQHLDEVKICKFLSLLSISSLYIYLFSDQQLLKKKRMDQTAAVKNLIHMGDGDKQRKTVLELISAIMKVLSSSRNSVESAKYDPKSRKFPADQQLRERVCEILENTPFFLEFALYYPNVVRKIYSKGDITDLILWTYRFSLDFGIYDDSTLKMINLAAQELNIIERDEEFINPYDRLLVRDVKQMETISAAKEAKAEKERKKKEYMKKQKRQNGP